MKHQADDWPKEPLNGVFIASILFLSILPSLGWAWHRVLPEHTHIYLGIAHSDADEMLAAAPLPGTIEACLDCSIPEIDSGVAHLPSSDALQVLGMAAAFALLLLSIFPPLVHERVVFASFLYRSPIRIPPDPPPNASG